MNCTTKPVELQTLSSKELLNIRYDTGGKLVLLQETTAISPPTSRPLKISEKARLRSAYYWLNSYQPEPNASNLEQVRGYIEAFHHLCELSAWQEAAQILLTRLNFTLEKTLHEQIGTWGYYREQIELYRRLLGKIDLQFDCLCLQGLGNASCWLGKIDEAIEYHQQQLEIARKIKNKKMEASALGGLGFAYSLLEKLKVATHYHQQQLEIAREHDFREEEVLALAHLGRNLCLSFKEREAIKMLQQALKLSKALNNIEVESFILEKLSDAYCMLGKPNNAIKLLKRNLGIDEKLNDLHGMCYTFITLSKSYIMLDRFDRAEKYGQNALKIAELMDYDFDRAVASGNLGLIYSHHENQYDRAIAYFEQALQTFINLEQKTKIGIILTNLSYCYTKLKQYQTAMDYTRKSLAIAREIKNKDMRGLAISMMANAYWHRGQHLRGLLTVAWAMIILPPWKSANGKFLFKKAFETIFSFLK
ncbi:tetratricopeptide repeat protein [Lusitaniella coriacea LEGE 07157]|uniref:Tetratricopeptide repeat protein n=1 Tax=Lusitaniella coriacea LEGE 07157 TaxID=945747 RepID=A0A8J7J2S5_9CYAN|nr:tetratricopeptide repeat protein [Lusitaniella coriacea]MBE9116539.1 tetratricopeptide repeat protein [Lusitaniella coriacea LEGE 07157]